MNVSDHLSPEDLNRYARGDAAPAELLALDDHLSGCAECRGRLASGSSLAGWAANLGDDETRHLTHDQLIGRVENRLMAKEAAVVDRHLAGCLSCRDELADLSQFRQSSRRRQPRQWLIPASIAAALVVGLFMWRSGNTKFQFPADWSAADRTLVEQMLSTGTLPSATLPEDIAAKPGTLLGPSAPNSFAPIEPLNAIVYSDRPVFRWQELAGAAGYRVEIYDANFRLVANSPPIKETSWTPPNPLGRGVLYRWQIVATKDGRDVTAPAPPAAEARFRVLDASTMARIESLRNGSDEGHLLAAALLAQNGLRAESIHEIDLLRPETRKLLHNIRD